jgi:glycosyltransferase involved in cell wall biosynthesis
MSQANGLLAISSYGPTAASTRVRLDDWFRFFGIEAMHSYYAGLSNNRPRSIAANTAAVTRAEFALHRLDVAGQRVVLSREASPFSRGAVEERLLSRASHGTYDFDDAIFDDPSPIHRFLGTHDKCRRAALAADVVIAGNDYLANWAECHSKDVRIIPSCIEPRDYTQKTNWSIRGDVPVLVWLGSPATEHYLAEITPVLLEAHRRTGAVLTLISGRAHNSNLGLLSQMIHRSPWSIGTVASAMAKADVAIAPLDDSAYSRGKCAYKLLQYAAAGLPIVGSPVGANSLALKRFCGIAVTNANEWIEALMAMIGTTSEERRMRGATGIRAVNEHYSFATWSSAWKDAVGAS